MPGGEDSVFKQESSLLRSGGNEVREIKFYNSTGIKGLIFFLKSVWNFSSSKIILRQIHLFEPDIIHFHNIHFTIGPLILRLIKPLNIPIVMTLHNYRLLCPSATLFSHGDIFLKSINQKFPWVAVKKRIYRNSFFQTFWTAFVISFHKRINTWDNINRFIVLTSFAKNIYQESNFGFNFNQFIVKPNFVQRPIITCKKRSNSFLFIGRLSEEKGIDLLLESFISSGFFIRIGGDGPLKEMVLMASYKYSNITFLGALNKNQVIKEMESCNALIFPSIWYEGMPMTIIEAFSLGTPVIANKLGAMESMIEHGINGLHFNQSSFDLVSKLEFWNNLNDFEKDKFSKGALESYEKNYTPEKNLKILLSIYESVLDESKKKGN